MNAVARKHECMASKYVALLGNEIKSRVQSRHCTPRLLCSCVCNLKQSAGGKKLIYCRTAPGVPDTAETWTIAMEFSHARILKKSVKVAHVICRQEYASAAYFAKPRPGRTNFQLVPDSNTYFAA
ncbi:unnamed protein product [Danaus chrysippus]|uniref:(African queen) hypothetical protein n=1 Tax=Danaus chrysippus TaxID=151541 RepID=A0A8J2R8Z6_9NEOP|nr:unnamed protein product [Danaus chrysippus]